MLRWQQRQPIHRDVRLIVLSQKKKTPAAMIPRNALRWDRPFIKSSSPPALPVIVNEVFWSLGMTTYINAFSGMGIDVIASVNVTEAINSHSSWQ